MHKGFKYLDVKEGRVNISRNVVFDENVFPFASLHPNAGAKLRSEILLLPEHLTNPSTGGIDCDPTLTLSSASNDNRATAGYRIISSLIDNKF